MTDKPGDSFYDRPAGTIACPLRKWCWSMPRNRRQRLFWKWNSGIADMDCGSRKEPKGLRLLMRIIPTVHG
ncbi:hypothetical protein H5996_07550 [Faecalicoccus pleomorphus]|uniref:hypothetical protein n=1 Tax=Faecalicoccus pleomorphus TaxID=1323 RepID=UPI00195FB795|nr:hypothetical protein [Faecalicoccus pleomorphus]